MERTDLVAQAVRLALAAGMAGVISISPAYAQDETDELAVQEKITVTGSRIKRADYEGPLPVTVITREDIDASGEISVAEVLRTQTFNTFGSGKQQSGSLGGNANTVSMRGLGPWYTLVLVNGRRMASAPTVAVSVQNLSVIPMAAVERIEVLRDGASAIYGTDALAGVINIILRKDYSGINLSYYIGRPTQSGGDEDSYSITGGVSGAKGNVTFGMDVQQQDIVYNRDRDFTLEGNTSSFGFPGSYFAYLTTDDPRNPLDHFLSVGTFADPRCPDEIGEDPDFPWSIRTPNDWGGERCRYAYSGVSATEASNDTKSFFVDANYDISDDISFFTRGIFTFNEVDGRYAPSPIVPTPSMSQDATQNPTNPDNPTNYRGDPFEGQSIDVDADGDGIAETTVQGPFDLSVFYRNVPGGNRDSKHEDVLLDYLAGMRGTVDWLGGADWEVAAQWSEQTSNYTQSGEALIPFVQAEIDDRSYDIFGVFGPYGNDEIAAARRATATASADARHRITGGDAQLTFDAFQLDDGPVPVALGFEYRDEDYELGVDEQSASGAIGGGGVEHAHSAARVVKSIFAEGLIPVLTDLEVNIAGRHDDYNDFGTTFNPKISVAYRPLDTLLLRASYGTGFLAPDFSLLYEPIQVFGGGFIDSWQCSQTAEDSDGDGRADMPQDQVPEYHPCKDKWYDSAIRWGGNRDLQPEESDNWTAGVVWSPTAHVSLVLDYYNIQIDEQIWGEELQPLLDEEFRLRQSGESGSTVGRVTRTASGRINSVFQTYENIETVETDGVDAEIAYLFSVGKIGDFSTRLRWTRVLSYEKDYSDGNGVQDWVGEVGFPEDRGQLTISWSLGDYAATVVGNYIADQDGSGPWNDHEDEHLASFTTWDVQASYSAPWNGQITVGARNVFDRDPPLFSRWGDSYDITQHEVYGRVPYLRLEQDF
jgi:iron complex outermembrane receptor protein